MFQIGSALLDALVLSVASREDTYGYVLTQEAKEVMSISESTLYPVLRRLEKNGFLETYDLPCGGRLRRYYKITDIGRETLKTYKTEWFDYRSKVDAMLLGANDAQTPVFGENS